jgi:hypothetical protein
VLGMGFGTKVRSMTSEVKERMADARLDNLTRENDELKVENELLREELDSDKKSRDRMMSLLDRLDVEARPKRRIGLVRVLVIGGAAYVLGAKAGRERYEQMRAWWEKSRQKAMNRANGKAESWSTSSTMGGSELEHRVGQGI